MGTSWAGNTASLGRGHCRTVLSEKGRFRGGALGSVRRSGKNLKTQNTQRTPADGAEKAFNREARKEKPRRARRKADEMEASGSPALQASGRRRRFGAGR